MYLTNSLSLPKVKKFTHNHNTYVLKMQPWRFKLFLLFFQKYIATIPLVMYFCGFASSLVMKSVSKRIGTSVSVSFLLLISSASAFQTEVYETHHTSFPSL